MKRETTKLKEESMNNYLTDLTNERRPSETKKKYKRHITQAHRIRNVDGTATAHLSTG